MSDSKVILANVSAVVQEGDAPASGGVDAVAVKALEWVHDGEHYRADAGFEIKYSVFRRLDGWFDAVLLGTAIGHGYLSATTAKEACQADYEQRIRSALSPAATPVSKAEPEAWEFLPREMSDEMMDAGQTYLNEKSLNGRFTLPGGFNWHEFWRVVVAQLPALAKLASSPATEVTMPTEVFNAYRAEMGLPPVVMTPTAEGFFWARWLKPAPGTADNGEGCDPERWEVVSVFENSLDTQCEEYLMVMVLGVEQSQPLENFEWGAEVRRV